MDGDDLTAELERARSLDVDELAEAVRAIGFECTRCGACCRGHGDDEAHTATVFPDEVRAIAGHREKDRDHDPDPDPDPDQDSGRDHGYDWRDVARPMPFGLRRGEAGPEGETFEWALAADDCGDCTFYAGRTDRDENADHRGGTCTVYEDRPLICRTYPFSVDLGAAEPMGEVVEREGVVRAHECEGLGREISREEAEALARTLKERAIREVDEMIAVRERYEPADPGPGEVVVHDAEGAKRPDGSPWP